MNALAKRFVLWIIGLAAFVGGYIIVEKIFEGDSYSFTIKGSILAPIVTYLLFCVLMFIFNRIGGKKKKNKE